MIKQFKFAHKTNFFVANQNLLYVFVIQPNESSRQNE